MEAANLIQLDNLQEKLPGPIRVFIEKNACREGSGYCANSATLIDWHSLTGHRAFIRVASMYTFKNILVLML